MVHQAFPSETFCLNLGKGLRSTNPSDCPFDSLRLPGFGLPYDRVASLFLMPRCQGCEGETPTFRQHIEGVDTWWSELVKPWDLWRVAWMGMIVAGVVISGCWLFLYTGSLHQDGMESSTLNERWSNMRLMQQTLPMRYLHHVASLWSSSARVININHWFQSPSILFLACLAPEVVLGFHVEMQMAGRPFQKSFKLQTFRCWSS